MRDVRWNPLKAQRLKRLRGVSFEEILQAQLLAIKQHPSRTQQHLLLFLYKGYIWVVPCIMSKDDIVLKTLFPSRKYTKLYKRGEL